MRWDEKVIRAESLKSRQLVCRNFKGFYISAGDLITEQLYEPLGNNNCKLTFTLCAANKQMSILDELKFYYAGFTIVDIFKENLERVKGLLD